MMKFYLLPFCLAFLFFQNIQGQEVTSAGQSRYEFTRGLMGTEFRILLHAEDTAGMSLAVETAFHRVEEVEQIFSDYREDSEVSKLSEKAGTGVSIEVSAELWEVLTFAQQVSKKSKGAFDVSAGALTKLWRRAIRQKQMPPEADIAEARQTVGYQAIKLKCRSQSVQLKKTGMRLDFGGIAKGYAVDEALKVLQNAGFNCVLADGGGDILAGDAPPGSTGWTIEIRTVRSGKLTSQTIVLVNRAIATSGATYKFLEWEGQRYSHILDPRTGMGITSRRLVTVVAPSCMAADAWATALSVESDQEILEMLQKQGIEVVVTTY